MFKNKWIASRRSGTSRPRSGAPCLEVLSTRSRRVPTPSHVLSVVQRFIGFSSFFRFNPRTFKLLVNHCQCTLTSMFQYRAEMQQMYRCLNLSAISTDLEVDADGSSSHESNASTSCDVSLLTPSEGSPIAVTVPEVRPLPLFTPIASCSWLLCCVRQRHCCNGGMNP